jgi:integrase
MYTGAVRAIYKKARIEFNDPDLGIMRIPVDIFEYYKVPRVPAAEHRDIPAEWIQMMLDQREGLEGRERMAIDVFLLSFGLMGINSIDLYNVREQPKDGVLHYFRTKTTDRRSDGAEMFVRIEECVRGLVNEYRGKERTFRFHTMYATDNTFNAAINKGLKSWKSRNGLEDEDKFTFYSARHTWATLGASKRVGIDLALVTEGLCHVDQGRKVDMVYIRKDWERVWDANAKVLGLFQWK